jgi:hypothetical protein
VDRYRPCAFPSDKSRVSGFEFRVLELETQNSQLETIPLDSGIVQSDSPLTVAGPCWVCHAALRGATHQLPLHPGAPNSTRNIPFSCRLLPPPFRHLVHHRRSKDPAHISLTTKNPDPRRRIGVFIPKPDGKPTPRSTRYATRPPFPSEGHQHLGAGQVPGSRLTLEINAAYSCGAATAWPSTIRV